MKKKKERSEKMTRGPNIKVVDSSFYELMDSLEGTGIEVCMFRLIGYGNPVVDEGNKDHIINAVRCFRSCACHVTTSEGYEYCGFNLGD